jgi:Putative prokaryotic signal transducing protein
MGIPESNEKIIVLQQFDNPITASLAKSKLDAHDVPCFLTEEHFSNLYPSNYLLNNGVRLHIFEKDKERAQEILFNSPSKDTDD